MFSKTKVASSTSLLCLSWKIKKEGGIKMRKEERRKRNKRNKIKINKNK